MDSEGDSEVSSPTWSIDDGHSEMTTSTDEMFAVEGDSGCSPDIGDDNLTCERIAAIQDEDLAVMVQVSYLIGRGPDTIQTIKKLNLGFSN